MTTEIIIRVTGLPDAVHRLGRAQQMAGAIQQDEIHKLGTRYLARLKEETPLGKGENPGRLLAGYQTEETYTATTARFRITNTTPHLKYVLKGRGPVTVKRAKALRFVISGRVFFRRSVGPAAPNRFDQRVRAEMQPEIRAVGLNIRTRIVAAYRGAS